MADYRSMHSHEEVAREYIEREGWQLIVWEPRDFPHVRVVLQDSKEHISDLEVHIPNGLDPMDVWGCIEREYKKQFDGDQKYGFHPSSSALRAPIALKTDARRARQSPVPTSAQSESPATLAAW